MVLMRAAGRVRGSSYGSGSEAVVVKVDIIIVERIDWRRCGGRCRQATRRRSGLVVLVIAVVLLTMCWH